MEFLTLFSIITIICFFWLKPDNKLVLVDIKAGNEEIQFSLDSLRSSPNYRVRLIVATHPQTNKDTLYFMSGDPFMFIRKKIAKHPNSSSKTLKVLAQDPCKLVRDAAAVNCNYHKVYYVSATKQQVAAIAQYIPRIYCGYTANTCAPIVGKKKKDRKL